MKVFFEHDNIYSIKISEELNIVINMFRAEQKGILPDFGAVAAMDIMCLFDNYQLEFTFKKII